MTPQIKRCNACREVKVLADFHRHPTNRDGRQGTCKRCSSERVPRHRHGLTRVQKAEMAEAQGGCLTCRTGDPGPKGWVVDHDHRCCGPIRSCERCRRGILCGRCNTALGMAGDSPEVLRRLADYLEQHAARTTALRESQGPRNRESQTGDAPAAPYVRTDELTEMELQLRGDLT